MPTFSWDSLEKFISIYFNGLPRHTPNCICIGNQNSDNLNGACWKMWQFAELVGASQRTVSDWKTLGKVPAYRADEIAIKLLMMPYEIWPEWEHWADECAFDVQKLV